jgi:hypothetical protein
VIFKAFLHLIGECVMLLLDHLVLLEYNVLFRSRTSKGWSTDVSVDAGKMSGSSK